MMKLVPGMLDGARNARAVPNGEAVCWFTPRETDDIELGALKLTDRATFLLALDALAKRVGLDPAGGVWWRRGGRYEWTLRVQSPGGLQCGVTRMDKIERRFSRYGAEGLRHILREYPDLYFQMPMPDTDDPLVALRAALEATE